MCLICSRGHGCGDAFLQVLEVEAELCLSSILIADEVDVGAGGYGVSRLVIACTLSASPSVIIISHNSPTVGVSTTICRATPRSTPTISIRITYATTTCTTTIVII